VTTSGCFAQIEQFEPAGRGRLPPPGAHSRRIFEVGYEQLADRPFSRAADMLRVLPQMMRLGSHRSVYDVVSSYIRDERLRQAFSFEPLLVGGNPFRTTSIYLLIHWLERKWGVHFARGGTTSIVHGLVRLLGTWAWRCAGLAGRAHHGEATAAQRRGAGPPASPAGGRRGEQRGSVVRLRPDDRCRPARRHTDAAPAARAQSMGLFVAYFGTTVQYPEVKHHTIVLGPRYRICWTTSSGAACWRTTSRCTCMRRRGPIRPGAAGARGVLRAVAGAEQPVGHRLAGARPYFDRIMEALERRLLPGLRSSDGDDPGCSRRTTSSMTCAPWTARRSDRSRC
jgi:phytoene desaturase